jgi:hypothetical protein
MNVPNKKRKKRSQAVVSIADDKAIISIQPLEQLKTREQFADELNICSKTMKKYLKAAHFSLPKGLIKVLDQERIRQIVLGIPNNSN